MRRKTDPSSFTSRNVIHTSIRSTNRRHYPDDRTVKHKKDVISSVTKPIQSPTKNHSVTPVNPNDIITKATLSGENCCIDDNHRNKNRKRACSACRFAQTSLLIGALILGTAIAALLVGVLTRDETTTTQTTITTTTTTSTTTRMSLLTTTNETVYGIWNTTAGGNSASSTSGTNSVGNYYPGQTPDSVFDNDTNTKYTSFGTCVYSSGTQLLQCGENTGFYFTSSQGRSFLLSVQFCTGNDLPERDPLTIIIEGSDQSPSLLTLGSSWTLFYNGSNGLQSIFARSTWGAAQSISNNLNWYSSYRILVTSKRAIQSGTQYSEVNLVGYV